MLIAWLLFVLTAFQGPETTVRLLDGSQVKGTPKSIDIEAIEIDADGKTQKFEAKQLQRIEFPAAESIAKSDELFVALRDGSVLSVAEFSSDSRKANFTTHDRQTISLPINEVAWIRFRPLTANLESGWNEQLEKVAKSDRLVVLRESGAIDIVEGVINQIGKDAVKFDFDGSSIDAPRAKLLGLVLFATKDKKYPPPKVIAQDAFGGRLFCSAVKLDLSDRSNPALSLESPSGWKALSSVTQWKSLDFSASNLQLATELKPLASSWFGAANYIGNAKLSEAILAPHAASFNVESGSADSKQAAAKLDLVFTSAGEIEYRVPEGMTHFRTATRLSPRATVQGTMVVSIQQDADVLWKKELRSGIDELIVDLDVKPQKRLKISVRALDPKGQEDTVWLLQPRFVK